jgi:hypothetical protein
LAAFVVEVLLAFTRADPARRHQGWIREIGTARWVLTPVNVN